jgi:hypothetical protein
MSARNNKHGADLEVDANHHRAYVEDMERHTPTQGETQMTKDILSEDLASLFDEVASENAVNAKREDESPVYQARLDAKRANATRREIAAGLRSLDGEWIDHPDKADDNGDDDA